MKKDLKKNGELKETSSLEDIYGGRESQKGGGKIHYEKEIIGPTKYKLFL